MQPSCFSDYDEHLRQIFWVAPSPRSPASSGDGKKLKELQVCPSKPVSSEGCSPKFGTSLEQNTPSEGQYLVVSRREGNRINEVMERAMGIEPTSEAWEASILPLYDARSASLNSTQTGSTGTSASFMKTGEPLRRAGPRNGQWRSARFSDCRGIGGAGIALQALEFLGGARQPREEKCKMLSGGMSGAALGSNT